jgi:hypothetical protein
LFHVCVSNHFENTLKSFTLTLYLSSKVPLVSHSATNSGM